MPSISTGERDATRYLARITPRDICETGDSVSDQADRLAEIVRNAISGESVLGTGITVSGVDPSVDCVEGSFRFGDAPVVAVEAMLNITLPFGQVFSLATGTLGPISTTVTDQQRVFGS